MSEITVCVAGIEIYVFGAEEQPGAPVVFVTHGRGGEAAHVFALCRDLAGRGMIAVAVEQRNHGKRLVDVEANGEWNMHHAADMYGNFVGTAMDVSLLIDIIPARLGIAMERVGMTGMSMGGHATLVAMALDSRIQVGAALIGSGDYRRLMELRALNNDTPLSEFDRYFPPSLQAAVERFDPIHHPERFADRPVLLTSGAQDMLVPGECNQCFADACRPYYTQPERLQFTIYPGIGHDVPPAMLEEAALWLQRWLINE